MSNDIIFVEQGQDDHPVLLDHLVDDGGQHGADVGQHGEAQRDPNNGVDHTEATASTGLRGYVAIPSTVVQNVNSKSTSVLLGHMQMD